MKAPDYLKRAVREERSAYIEDSELLSVLLSIDPDKARTMLSGRNIKELSMYTGVQLRQLLDITEHQASVLSAGLMLGRRSVKHSEFKQQISCPADAANVLIPILRDLDREELWVLILNTRNWIIDERQIYRGTVNSSAIRPAEVLKPAVMVNAPAVIIAHNHPSGDPTPSPEDISVTRDMVAAGKLLDITVNDHIIVAGNQYVSLKEKGLGF